LLIARYLSEFCAMRLDFPICSLALLVAAVAPARADSMTVFQDGKNFPRPW